MNMKYSWMKNMEYSWMKNMQYSWMMLDPVLLLPQPSPDRELAR